MALTRTPLVHPFKEFTVSAHWGLHWLFLRERKKAHSCTISGSSCRTGVLGSGSGAAKRRIMMGMKKNMGCSGFANRTKGNTWEDRHIQCNGLERPKR